MSSPFTPRPASTVSVSVSAASQRVQLKTDTVNASIRIYNAGSAVAFVEFGDSTVTAALATGTPIPAGVVEVLSVTGTYVAVIAVGATGSIYFTPGVGI